VTIDHRKLPTVLRTAATWPLALALAGVVYAVCPAQAQDDVVELRLGPYVGRLVTLTAVVGGDTLPFLLDTGGGETLITPAVAERLRCTPSGRTVGFRMSGERVEFALCDDVTLTLAGHAFPHPDIAVFDIASLLPADWPPLGGVISLKTFADRAITLDLEKARLIIESQASVAKRVAPMTRVPSRVASGTDGRSLTVFLRMRAPTTGWYLLDSANLDVVRVRSHAISDARQAVGDGETSSGPVRFEGAEAVEAQWRVADIIYDGALSEAYLRQWVITLDLPNGTTWVTRAGT